MKKSVIVFLALFFLISLISTLVKSKFGDVRPAILPSGNILKKLGSTNKNFPTTSNAPLTVPEDFVVTYFSRQTPGVRDIQITEGGTLLASLMSKSEVVVLPDIDKNGEADEVKTIISGLDRPHGIAVRDQYLFVAEETSVTRYLWNEQNLTATFDKKLFDLPSGGRHFTRSIAIEKDGTMYVSLGSTCDVCFEKHPFIGTVIISTTEGKKPEVFAQGLRNSVFIKLDAQEKLWGTEMGRDFLGDNLPPDEINILEKGQNYGWPVCYGNKVYDQQFGQRSRSYCDNTIGAAFNLPAHVAPLGLTFVDSDNFPVDWQGDLLVGLHGSWNSSVPVGYKVVRLSLEGEKVVSMEDFITGFIEGNQAIGRPVDVEFGPDGGLYVSDDKAGVVYKVVNSSQP